MTLQKKTDLFLKFKEKKEIQLNRNDARIFIDYILHMDMFLKDFEFNVIKKNANYNIIKL